MTRLVLILSSCFDAAIYHSTLTKKISTVKIRAFRLDKSVALFSLCMFLSTAGLHAQVKPAAIRGSDIQIGAEFNLASPDYGPDRLRGFGFYFTDDFRPHWGFEANFHQLNDPNSKVNIFERTYEIGPRYSFHFGPFRPYAKMMAGRGVFQFPPDPLHPANGPVANLAYTIFSGGFGADYKLKPHINLRADYELQRWSAFPPNGLSPHVFSVGIAFHTR